MDNKMKLRIAALKRLAKQGLSPDEYVDGVSEIKRDEAKALLHRTGSPAAADKDRMFDKKMRDTRARLDELADEGKSEEQLEKEAYDRLYDERLKKGMLTKPFKRFKK